MKLFFLNLFLLLSGNNLDDKKVEVVVSSAKEAIETYSAKEPIEAYSAKSAKGVTLELPEPPSKVLDRPMLPPLPPIQPINPPPVTKVNP